jgi:hypothetical protein
MDRRVWWKLSEEQRRGDGSERRGARSKGQKEGERKNGARENGSEGSKG